MASQPATSTAAVSSEPGSKPDKPIQTTDHHRHVRKIPPTIQVKTSSPRFAYPPSPTTPNSKYRRRIAIAVDLSEESAYAVKWAVDNYLRPGDVVILLHVMSTSVLYGADWGSSTPTGASASAPAPFQQQQQQPQQQQQQQNTEEDYDSFTATKANHLAQPLVEAHVPFKIHIVKDHDMKERLCLEAERLELSAMITGSRGEGALRRSGKGKLGSVSDYCVQHCMCPVVVVRFNHEVKKKADDHMEDGKHESRDDQHK